MTQHHDPVHPDAGHLSAELLADLDLGLLDDESAGHARHHLGHCELCRGLHDDLAALTEALGQLPDAPAEPMPDQLWKRLSAQLAAEPVTTPEGSATVVPLAAERTRRRPGIGLVAGAAGVALLGAIAVSVLMNDGSGVDTLSSAGSAADDGAVETAPSLPPQVFAASRSGTVYKQDQLDEQVVQLVSARSATATASPSASATISESAGSTGGSTPEPGGSASSDSAVAKELRTVGPMATDPAAAQTCLEDYLDVDGIAPLAIDIGFWQGQPAAVIVLPLSDPTQAQVWVINPTCDADSSQDPLYYFATVSR
jgi:hypothetical protein